MHEFLMAFGKTADALSNPLAWLGGILIGVVSYLVAPGSAFYALWIVVFFDLISRITAEAKNHGGLIAAIKGRHICSDKAIQGTGVKIMAYFVMCVVANQSQYIFPYQTASEVFANIVYAILFLVESLSIAENFLEAGVQEFGWLKRFSKKKLEQIIEEGGEKVDNSGKGNGPPL